MTKNAKNKINDLKEGISEINQAKLDELIEPFTGKF